MTLGGVLLGWLVFLLGVVVGLWYAGARHEREEPLVLTVRLDPRDVDAIVERVAEEFARDAEEDAEEDVADGDAEAWKHPK